ncbi:MAG: ATP-binding protein [Candidatus Omnitrophota bacterium]|jgi:two-component system phosphate regulon sensor histidine kinase PhoR
MKIKKHSLKLKLIFSYVLIIALSFGLAAYFLNRNLEENSLREIKSSLISQGWLVVAQIPQDDIKNGNTPRLQTLAKTLSASIKSRLTIISRQGKVLADSEKPESGVLKMENHAQRPEIKEALAGAIGEEIRYSSTLKMDMLYVALPVPEKGQILGVVRLALPLASVQKTLFSVRKAILFSILFALGLSLVLGSLLTQATIKPINKIILASRRFSAGEFSHKILIDTRDEIGELAATLNKMAEGLEAKIKEVEIQNQHLRAILRTMVEGIIVTDKSGRIISINPTVEKIFNITQQGAEGKLLLEAVRNNDIAEIINAVLKNGKFISQELNLVLPAQGIFKINASPIFEKDAVIGCLLVIHDITEMRRLETMRRDFVANVSHELKTPLTSIKGFVETLLEGAMEDRENSRHFLGIIQNHSERLNNLINDLLDLSHIESREIKLEITDFSLRGLTEEVLSGFKSKAKEKALEITNALDKALSVKADKDKIEQVLTNLADNAIKFNRQNGTVRIYSEGLGEKIKVTIEDSGIGIPAKDLSRIFERFYRVDKARSRELGGTGLGLSIVKHIVELHGGSVGVESSEGLGSKFWFTLPQ